jgi:hypothetical protein
MKAIFLIYVIFSSLFIHASDIGTYVEKNKTTNKYSSFFGYRTEGSLVPDEDKKPITLIHHEEQLFSSQHNLFLDSILLKSLSPEEEKKDETQSFQKFAQHIHPLFLNTILQSLDPKITITDPVLHKAFKQSWKTIQIKAHEFLKNKRESDKTLTIANYYCEQHILCVLPNEIFKIECGMPKKGITFLHKPAYPNCYFEADFALKDILISGCEELNKTNLKILATLLEQDFDMEYLITQFKLENNDSDYNEETIPQKDLFKRAVCINLVKFRSYLEEKKEEKSELKK